MKIINKKAWRGLLILCGSALLGFVFANLEIRQLRAYAQERYAELQTFSKVLNLVQQYYVEPVDTRKLIYGGVKGMLRELDPHTNFLPPDVFKEFETETSGEFGGLGIEIALQNAVLTIISPIEDAPAWKAGVLAGDKIVGINGQSTKGLSLVEAAQLMRGKMGTPVTLSIVREGLENPKDIVVVRGNVKIKSVKYTDFENGYAYIRITSFIENTVRDLEKTLADHKKKHKDFNGLVLDLRRNPGGLLDQAIKMSDLFLEKGVIVSTIGRNKDEKEVVQAKSGGGYLDVPLVILINEYSASASEILAGALQDNKRALIVGQRSFGKGSVQSVVKLGDGSGLKLTVARYFTPSGRSIQAEGIVPDVEIENVDIDAYGRSIIKGQILREKDMEGHLLGEKEAAEKAGRGATSDAAAWWKDLSSKPQDKLSAKDKLLKADYQVFQAFNYLKAWKLMGSLGGAKETLAQ